MKLNIKNSNICQYQHERKFQIITNKMMVGEKTFAEGSQQIKKTVKERSSVATSPYQSEVQIWTERSLMTLNHA